MAIDAIIRVSFNTKVHANRAANQALVGHPQAAKATGPFERTGTAVYQCEGADDAAVGAALARLGQQLNAFADKIDFVSISLVRGRKRGTQ